MRGISRWLVLGVLIAGLVGCDRDPLHPASEAASRVAIDLTPLHRVTRHGVQQTCLTTIAAVQLDVDSDEGEARRYRDTLSTDGGTFLVEFDVEAEYGSVTFTASVLSNTEALLYRGATTEDVEEDDFYVEVSDVEAAGPVLQVCPEAVTLAYDDGAFVGDVLVYNRGNAPLDVEAVLPDTLCVNDAPCIEVVPAEETVLPDSTLLLNLFGSDEVSGAVPLRIQSESGYVDLPITTGERINRAPAFISTPPTEALTDRAYTYEVAAYDSDGDALSFDAPVLPQWLVLTDHQDGSATLAGTPTSDDAGNHDVVLRVSDGEDATEQPFTISVALNPRPVAIDDEVYTLEEQGLSFPVLDNDYDPNDEPLTVSLVSEPTLGLATIDDNEILYEPYDDTSGTDRFFYAVENERGLRDTAEVAVHVGPCVDFDAYQDRWVAFDSSYYDEPVHVENGVAVIMRTFEYGPNEPVRTGQITLADESTWGTAFGNAGVAFMEVANLEFVVPGAGARYVRFGFHDGGGSVNFAVNDTDNYVAEDLSTDVPLPPGFEAGITMIGEAGSMTLIATGETVVERLRVGGQELWVDQVCFSAEEPY